MQKIKNNSLIFILCIAAILTGCQPQHLKPFDPGPTSAAEQNFEALWQSARRVLKRRGFELDRQDRRDGVITTYAATSGHFFELWRKDAATIFHQRENAMQKIMRAVKVTLRRVKDTNRYDLNVEILMARSNKPPAQLTDSSQAMEIIRDMDIKPSRRFTKPEGKLTFGDLRRRATGRPGRAGGLTKATITPLDRDGDLEADLLEAIRQAAAKYDPIKAGAWITID